MEFDPPRVPTPSAFRRRERRRLALFALPFAALAVAFALWPSPAPAPDLFAALDDAEAALVAADDPDDDALALLVGDDPLTLSDDLMIALLGEGSL